MVIYYQEVPHLLSLDASFVLVVTKFDRLYGEPRSRRCFEILTRFSPETPSLHPKNLQRNARFLLSKHFDKLHWHTVLASGQERLLDQWWGISTRAESEPVDVA